MRLACVGDVGVDEYTNLGLRKPGGIALNVAVNAQRSGAAVSLVSALGDDPDGDAVLEAIALLGFDTTALFRHPGPTAHQSIWLGPDGERRFTGYRAGVLPDWRLSDPDLAYLAGHDALFAPLADGLEAIFEQVAAIHGPFKAADFSIDSDLADGSDLAASLTRYAPNFDCCFVGGAAEQLDLVARLAETYPATLFVLTLGRDGAIACRGAERVHQPAEPVARVVDTTGCGDAFQGAFLAAHLSGHDLPACLQAAAGAAASVITHVGATTLTLP